MDWADLVIQSLSRSFEQNHLRMEMAWTKLCEQVRREVNELEECMNALIDGELPTGIVSGREICLFPLGDFRDIWLGSLSGHSTLYLGEDGHLYEYGPVDTSLDVSADTPQEYRLIVCLQLVDFDELAYHELMTVRDLVRQIGI